MAKQCVFCGEKAGSREHVLPAWMARAAPKAFTESSGERNLYTGGQMKVIPHKFATMTVKCVCGTCNNGWMSRLEASVKPFLMQLTRGEQIALGPAEQTALATWSMKTAMMMLRASYLDDPHPIPKSDYKHLYEYGKLSMRRMRANAFYVEPPGDDEHHIWGDLRVLPFSTRYRGYQVKLRVGWFAVQLLSVALPPAYEIGQLGRTLRAQPLWPAQADQFTWPPLKPLPYETWLAMEPRQLAVMKRPV
ncbi:hypothetical protein ACFQ8C_31170 [Streptomyces sp. NPDC056503]|uniref:hypothetical protein n=1 Tax=Streptomyces sp. NPDC056503 TaxID=3345842 RepID=UPI00368C1A2B